MGLPTPIEQSLGLTKENLANLLEVIATLMIELADMPGRLRDISRIIADCGGNITEIHHERGNTENIKDCFLRVDLETRNYDHVEQIKQALRAEGFHVVEK